MKALSVGRVCEKTDCCVTTISIITYAVTQGAEMGQESGIYNHH